MANLTHRLDYCEGVSNYVFTDHELRANAKDFFNDLSDNVIPR